MSYVGQKKQTRLESYLTHSHTRWNSVRIHDNIRLNTIMREGHIFLSVSDTNGTLLTMSTRELISDLRYSCLHSETKRDLEPYLSRPDLY